MDAELLERLNRMIVLEKKCLSKFAEGTSQHSLVRNRIQALQIARKLISGENRPCREELEFALPRVESILHKTVKARDGHAPDHRTYKRLDPMVRDMKEVCAAILQALEG